MSPLVSVSQQLSSLEELEALLEAIPRLARTLVPVSEAVLVEQGEAGHWRCLAGGAVPRALSPARLHEALGLALREQSPRLVVEGTADGRWAVVPLQTGGRPMGLVMGLVPGPEPRPCHEMEQLAVFGSLCGAAITRARTLVALRQAAARDAATLSAVRDGLLTVDPEGVVRALNPAAQGLLGVRKEQVIGRPLRELAPLASLAEVLDTGRPLTNERISRSQGELLVCSQPYEGGTILTLTFQEPTCAKQTAGAPARFTFDDLVGREPAFLACLEEARLAARSDVPILITGESGTGKELLAQAIHRASPKASQPFVGINVAAFPRELLESELFGYERGAFTGARAGGNPGKFELASQGMILLDEIGDMPLEMQVKMLRVLQERTLQRLGGSRDTPLRARVVATTHRNLEVAVQEGTFRLDLFHRLRVVHLRLPPLRERRGDIPLLVERHLQRYASRVGRPPLRVSPQVMAALQAHDWPGNVRELVNLLEGAACLLPEGQEVIERLPSSVEHLFQRRGEQRPPAAGASLPPAEDRVVPFDEVERRTFEHALRHCAGNVAQAAKALGVAKGTFYSKIRRYGLEAPRPSPASYLS
ncbi:MAG TPA: sigma 54-interacting transcriptional regulator [Archangium sp.]|uniref:sigma-54 interaction domain-containing protein n=1 Tax=Archangium sp. TaxID=1872627 RepID=UPI002E32B982|nr:sigma 54-interacting transcriptional regulator [Archangium sp.]HEX5749432.1 sigma 54-interacting transcriptional regulator [Archangium sp.]